MNVGSLSRSHEKFNKERRSLRRIDGRILTGSRRLIGRVGQDLQGIAVCVVGVGSDIYMHVTSSIIVIGSLLMDDKNFMGFRCRSSRSPLVETEWPSSDIRCPVTMDVRETVFRAFSRLIRPSDESMRPERTTAEALSSVRSNRFAANSRALRNLWTAAEI